MLNEFREHIKNNFQQLQQNKFLLACSGGLDSMVLAHLCDQCEMDFALAHCNFKLRGEASDADADFVHEFADSIKKKLFVTHFDTISYVEKNKVSIEMAARTLRYAWFVEIMAENKIETLVTAHHADDDLETFIINLSRGTGIDGLKGIPAHTDTISRPLLPFSRAQIMSYAKIENLIWREDRTNAETVHLRNRIRHEIVPHLKELHPTFLENFKMTQSYLSDTAMMMDDYIALLKSKLFIEENNLIRINIDELSRLNPQKSYLHAVFSDYGFTAWDDILGLLNGMSGKEVRSKTHRLVRDRTHLLLEKSHADPNSDFLIQEGEVEITDPIHLSISENQSIQETTENILYVDKASLKYPLHVRKWKKGDYFYPFGMMGRKKLSKYFKDEKVDVISKGKQWLLCSDDAIVWVIGRRADHRYRVTENTENIVKVIFNK